MCILRSLIYVLLIRRYGVRSWFPWLTSLGVDVIGNGIISAVTVLRHNNKYFQLSNAEKNEVALLIYLFLFPFFIVSQGSLSANMDNYPPLSLSS